MIQVIRSGFIVGISISKPKKIGYILGKEFSVVYIKTKDIHLGRNLISIIKRGKMVRKLVLKEIEDWPTGAPCSSPPSDHDVITGIYGESVCKTWLMNKK